MYATECTWHLAVSCVGREHRGRIATRRPDGRERVIFPTAYHAPQDATVASLTPQFLNPHVSKHTAFSFPGLAAEVYGVRHIEYYEGDYAPNFLSDRVDDSYAEKIREHCEKAKVSVACIAAINDLTSPDKDSVAEDLRRLVKWAQHCKILECLILRINTGRLRLDEQRAKVLADRLKELFDRINRIKNDQLILAIENHPQVLRDDRDTELILEVIRRVGNRNLKTCPDVGAMAPGYWERAVELLTVDQKAGHLHLKPTVLGSPSSPEEETGIGEYGPILRGILQRHGFRGVATLEYTALRNLDADPFQAPYENLREAAVGLEIELARPRVEFPRARHGERFVNDDTEVTPPVTILGLLADGCEHRLQAQVRIYDFANEKEVYSQSVQGRPHRGQAVGANASFCTLAKAHPVVQSQCADFIEKSLGRIRRGFQDDAEICICPMGLISLSVPMMDYRTKNLYGAIVCSPWVEHGTEGMVEEAILRYVEPQGREHFEKSSLRIKHFSPKDLQESQQLVEGLAEDLASLYHYRHTQKTRIQRTTEVVDQLRELSRKCGPSEFLDELPAIFRQFKETLDLTGHIALYRGTQDDEIYELRQLAVDESGSLPATLRFPASGVSGRQADIYGEYLAEYLEKALPSYRSVSSGHFIGDVLALVCVRDDAQLSESTLNLIDHFTAEVEYLLASLQNLEESQRREKQLEVFIDRARHALAGPLQGIADRIFQLRACVSDAKLFSKKRISPLVNDLRTFAQEASELMARIEARLTGLDLRPQYRFALHDVAEIVRESDRKHYRAALKRKIRIITNGLAKLDPIECDKDKLGEVFDNLLSNAIKFAKESSRIDVTSMECSLETHADWPLPVPGQRFVVADTGLGVRQEDQERIFDPYVQGKLSPKGRVIPGMGLGLFICKRIVAMHGREITVSTTIPSWRQHMPYPENLQECFVEFCVDLPLETPRTAAAQEDASYGRVGILD